MSSGKSKSLMDYFRVKVIHEDLPVKAAFLIDTSTESRLQYLEL